MIYRAGHKKIYAVAHHVLLGSALSIETIGPRFKSPDFGSWVRHVYNNGGNPMSLLELMDKVLLQELLDGAALSELFPLLTDNHWVSFRAIAVWENEVAATDTMESRVRSWRCLRLKGTLNILSFCHELHMPFFMLTACQSFSITATTIVAHHDQLAASGP
eukprot:scaffold5770_cov101-Cylindrotheca_fusiformis.AAC.3